MNDSELQGNSLDNSQSMGNKKTEKAPLLSQRRFFRNFRWGTNNDTVISVDSENSSRTLATFAGVFAPVALSQISTLLFLRLGFVVGNLGLYLGLGTLTLAYMILLLTILSVCAISTNGAIEGGGAYFMISRTLGPEFGGAIGALFFFANIFSSALYATGCIEGIVDNFGFVGADNPTVHNFLPKGDWYNFGYSSCLNFFNLLVCLIGATMFARTTIAILGVVFACTLSVFISYLAIQHNIEVPMPIDNILANATGNYTGLSIVTLGENLYPSYGYDYTTGELVDFATVFGVLFTGVTGIMAGANMSGELKSPSKSIPIGTSMATIFTYVTYILLMILTASTTSRYLLQNDYMFMTDVNVWSPFVTIGVITATLSASLSCLIGASRILAALVKDNIYGAATAWIGLATIGSNPIGAVIVSAIFAQCVLLIGELNTIARFTSVLFLLSYFGTNLACLCLEWASAPNFRPTFKYFSWWTAALGIVTNGAMMFIISPIAAAICIIICLVLVIILHLLSPSDHHNWGSISQALIFHQVRKYLLILDSRKDHVKFWRPQILLMVANPRSACPLIDFVNDLKKSGLYVIGHVKSQARMDTSCDPCADEHTKFQVLVDHLKVKAFIEVTSANTIREGIHQLTRISGLGAMKPNTVVLGFRDNSPSEDFFNRETTPFYVSTSSDSSIRVRNACSSVLTDWRRECEQIDEQEFVHIIKDVLVISKNICICRHFHLLDKESILRSAAKEKMFIDIWPMNFFDPDELNVFDTSSLFLMQLATVLNMVSSWHRKTVLRVFLCVSVQTTDQQKQYEQVRAILSELRIQALIETINWDNYSNQMQKKEQAAAAPQPIDYRNITESYLSAINQLIRENSLNTAVSFVYLPCPPDNTDQYRNYFRNISTLTQHLHPTVMVHGVSSVTTSNL